MDIEQLHQSGKLPTMYYNQLNGKTAQQNYNQYRIGKNKKNDSFFLSLIENSLKAIV